MNSNSDMLPYLYYSQVGVGCALQETSPLAWTQGGVGCALQETSPLAWTQAAVSPT